MKYNAYNFIQSRREITNDERAKDLSISSKWIFRVLEEMEVRFTKGERSSDAIFYVTTEKLAEVSQCSTKTVQKARKELMNAGFIDSWTGHYTDKNGKKSEFPVTYYKLFR